MIESPSGETVNLLEKVLERKTPNVFRRVPDTTGPVDTVIIENFTCPLCFQKLDKAIAVGGEVRGWCGISQAYVRVIL